MIDQETSISFNIKLFRQGDEQEFRRVFDLYYNLFYLFAYNMIKTQAEAKDIATDGFIKLWKSCSKFKSLMNIKAFLFVVTKNACLDHLRQIKKHDKACKEIWYLSENERQVESHVENEMIDAEMFDHLHQEIESLPERCKEVFKLLFYEGLSTGEIAAQLNMNLQTVLNQKTRAVNKLKSTMITQFLLRKAGIFVMMGIILSI